MRKLLLTLLLLLPFTVGAQIDVDQGGTGNDDFGSGGFIYSDGGITPLYSTSSPAILNDYVPDTRTIEVAGTANQITSSAGAQDLSANRTWTLSLPSFVSFPGSYFADSGTTTNSTSTNLAVTTSFNFLGTVITNVSTWFNGLFDTQLATKDTDDLTQGATNLYNQTHTGEVTGATGLTIADNVVDEANLLVNAPTNGYVLTASTTAAGGFAWEPNTDTSGFVPYTGATGDVDLGANELEAEAVRANSSAGLLVEANNGTDSALFGVGNTANALFSGGVNITGALRVLTPSTFTVDALTSALMLTDASGVFAEYAGTACTNQFVRSLSALGVATCATVQNTDLANSTVSYGGVTVSLGGSDATPAFNLVDATGLPISTGVSGLGANVATFLATPSSANLDAAVTDDTGSGALVFATSPTLVTPILGDASATTVTVSGTSTLATTTVQNMLLVGTTTSAVGDYNGMVYVKSADGAAYTYLESSGGTRWRAQGGDSTFVIGDGIGSPVAIDSGLGVGSLRLTSTGLGLGTTIPTAKLDVRGDVSQRGGNVTFNADTTDRDFNINGLSQSNVFFVDASTNRVSIGANEINPATILHIKQNDTATTPTVEVEQHSTGDAGIQLSIVGDSYANCIDNSDGDKLKWSYAGTAGTAVCGTNDLLTLDPATGYFGVGTASPAGRLHVYESAANAFAIIQTALTNGQARFQFQNDAQTWLSGVNSNDHFIITDSTTGPNTPFLIEAGSANNAIRVDSSGEVVINEDGLSTLDLRVEGDTDANLLCTDAVNNRVGIGTCAPSFPLHVEGGSSNIPLQVESTGSTAQIKLNGTGTMQFTLTTTQGAARTAQLINNGTLIAFKNATDDTGEFALRGTSNINGFVYNFGAPANTMRIESTGNTKLGGSSAVRATTEGTNHLDIFNGTAPVGTLTNGISLYSTAGELRVMDAGGTATLLSPHDEDNKWVFSSEDAAKGTQLHIDVEDLLRTTNSFLGTDYVHGDMTDVEDATAPQTLADLNETIAEQQKQIDDLEARLSKLERGGVPSLLDIIKSWF